MTILETRTALAAAEVLKRAREFYQTSSTPHSAYLEHAGDDYLRFRVEVGEVVIAVLADGGETIVRGSASRGVAALSRFLSLLGAPMDVRQITDRHGVHRRQGAVTGRPLPSSPSPDEGMGMRDRAA